EKDYYCSLLLRDLDALFERGLVFKGGTCLSKVHGDFFRLSEDLDFGISVKSDAPYKDRREQATPLKVHFQGLANRLPCFSVDTPVLSIHNRYKHITAKFQYTSFVSPGDRAFIKVEFSLREEVLKPAEQLTAKTMLIDPLSHAVVL